MARFALLVIALLPAALALEGSDSDIKSIFDKLLAEDGVELSRKQYAFRLGRFVKSYRRAAEGSRISLDLMMTRKERKGRNGAVPDSSVQTDEELQKREEKLLLEMRAPASYDSRSAIGLNEAVNQLTCGNCYLHTFVGALEIAYKKETGQHIKFSEQEMTDCFFKGCDGGDYQYVAKNMATMDKLSTRAEYGPYLDGVFTCRANTTQDALLDIKIVGTVDVSPDNLDASIVKYGSVMTCIKWGGDDDCELDGHFYTGGVFEGKAWDKDTMGPGCDHAVLIVGYTPSYLIVRNSHGKEYGEEGYFKIKRDINSCGIEDGAHSGAATGMKALVVERRAEAKTLASNRCPADKPIHCEDINTCIPSDESCVSPAETLEKRDVTIEEVRMALEEDAEDEGRVPGKIARLAKRDEEKRKKVLLDNFGKRSARKKGNKMIPGLQEVELVEKDCTEPEECEEVLDWMGTCADFWVAETCPVSCDECGDAPPSDEIMGNCYKPEIENGVVINGASMLAPGEQLLVECNPGYTLVGPSSTCLIQNVYTNEATDARLMPECIKVGGESYTGSGLDYVGSRSTFENKYGQTGECLIWDQAVFEGELFFEENPKELALGMHNYCRNPGGNHEEPVPYCLSGTGGVKTYCFRYPGCSECPSDVKDDPKYAHSACARPKCEYWDSGSKAKTDYYWTHCPATCCAAAGCI